MMRVLVTGAHGFIGSHLCERLLEEGWTVRALVSPWGRLDNLSRALESDGLEMVRADITDAQSIAGACRGADVVVHAAARVADWGSWEAFRRTNVTGTENLVGDAVRHGVRRFVLVSSVAVHRYSGFRDADPRLVPRNSASSAYARSKVEAEDAVMARAPEPVIVRPGLWPFGQRDPNLARIVRALRSGLLPMVGSGDSVINTAYVGNLVEGIRLAAVVPEAAGRAYVIADAGMPSWNEVLGHLARLVGAGPPSLHLPPALALGLATAIEKAWTGLLPHREPPLTVYRAGLTVHDVHFSIRHAETELGYRPRWTWSEGLERSLAGG